MVLHQKVSRLSSPDNTSHRVGNLEGDTANSNSSLSLIRPVHGGMVVDELLQDLDPFSVEIGSTQDVVRIPSGQLHIGVLLATDLLVSALSVPGALLLLSLNSAAPSNSLSHFWRNVETDASFPIAIVLAMAMAGFYRTGSRAPYESSFAELKELTIALSAGCVLSIGFSLILHLSFGVIETDSTQLLLAAIVAIALITSTHAVIGALRRGVHSRMLIIGSGTLVDRLTAYFNLIKGVEVIGRVVDALTAEDGSLGTVSDLPKLCEVLRINRIIIAYPTSMSQESVTIFRSLPWTIHVAIVPRYFELISWRSRISDLYGFPLVEVAPPHLSQWDRFLKRGFDVIGSSILLLVLSPIALLLSILVKFSSSGPILFRQERAGQGRRPFTIYKFRSMVESDPTPVCEPPEGSPDPSIPLHELRSKAVEATRITRIGRLMRQTGLDEIPQFVNVLLGNMSLVGPRPFIESESDSIRGWAAMRFDLRPGITGLWQVSGRNDLGIDDLRRLDFLYVASWSLWWDIKIVWDTPRAMVRGFGAY
jgi:exopolysaccharide biosynthesis polyprenyl glycosylphosphotransferase